MPLINFKPFTQRQVLLALWKHARKVQDEKKEEDIIIPEKDYVDAEKGDVLSYVNGRQIEVSFHLFPLIESKWYNYYNRKPDGMNQVLSSLRGITTTTTVVVIDHPLPTTGIIFKRGQTTVPINAFGRIQSVDISSSKCFAVCGDEPDQKYYIYVYDQNNRLYCKIQYEYNWNREYDLQEVSLQLIEKRKEVTHPIPPPPIKDDDVKE